MGSRAHQRGALSATLSRHFNISVTVTLSRFVSIPKVSTVSRCPFVLAQSVPVCDVSTPIRARRKCVRIRHQASPCNQPMTGAIQIARQACTARVSRYHSAVKFDVKPPPWIPHEMFLMSPTRAESVREHSDKKSRCISTQKLVGEWRCLIHQPCRPNPCCSGSGEVRAINRRHSGSVENCVDLLRSQANVANPSPKSSSSSSLLG